MTIEELEAKVDVLGVRVGELRSDVESCKSAMRDADSARDSYKQAADGFSHRLMELEESVAAIQTLRHDDDSPKGHDPTREQPTASADPGGSPGVDSMR